MAQKWIKCSFLLPAAYKLTDPCMQLLDVDPTEQEEDGANVDLDSQRKGKCAVIKTSTRQVCQ